MERKSITSVLLVLILFLLFSVISAQEVVWSEDFSAYVENTGYEGSPDGPVAIGDYPDNVTKWTLNVSNCTLSDANDYLKTREYMRYLQGRDLDGEAVWQSENIDITAYSMISFSLKASQSGSMNVSDYFDVWFSVDGGDFALIPNWNGLGSDGHTLTGAFGTTTILQSDISGNSLVVKVIMNNNGTWDIHSLDDIVVSPVMEYVSSTTTQNSLKIAAGKINQQIIGIEVVTSGTSSPLIITSFTVNANGTATPVENNIENARIYFTGSSDQFDAVNQFGTTAATVTTGDFDITGSQELVGGINYFWLTFDTKTSAGIGDVIDAECVSMIVNSSVRIPDITAPVGNRVVSGPLAGTFTIGTGGDYDSFGSAASELNILGINGEVTFMVNTGVYNEQIWLQEIEGSSDLNTITFQSSTGNAEDVILQFEPITSAQNYVVQLSGTDNISFQNMTVQNTGTSEFGRVFYFNGVCDYVQITGNNINGREVTGTLNWNQRFAYSVILVEESPDYAFNYGSVQNNIITGGSNAVRLSGQYNSPLTETGAIVTGNTITGFAYEGIHLYYQDAPVVNKNLLQSRDNISTEATGVMLETCTNGLEVTQNGIFLNSSEVNFGVLLWYCASSQENPGLTANNYIVIPGSPIMEGIGIMDSDQQKAFHNTLRITAVPMKSGYPESWGTSVINIECWDQSSCSPGGVQLLNNLVSNQSASPCFVVNETAANNSVVASDYNNFHFSGQFGTFGTSVCTTIEDWQIASGQDGSSTVYDPLFDDISSPLPGNSNIAEIVPTLPLVPLDIYDQPRSQPNTTPGAVQMGGVVPPVDYTWNGANENWFDPNNWIPPGVPTKDDNIIIPAASLFYPKIDGNAECQNVDNQGSLTLQSGKLETYGDVSNSGDIEQLGGESVFYQGIENTGEVAIHQGVLDALADIHNSGSWLIGGQTTTYENVHNTGDWKMMGATYTYSSYGYVNNQGEWIVEAGNSNYTTYSNAGTFEQTSGWSQFEGSVYNPGDWYVTGGYSNWYDDFLNSGGFNQSEGITTFHHLTSDGSSFVQSGGTLNIVGNLNYLNGLLDLNKLVFTGDGNSLVNFTGNNYIVNELRVKKNIPTVEVEFTISGPKYKVKGLTIERGNLKTFGSELEISGNADFSGEGEVIADKIIFAGGEDSQITPGEQRHENVAVDKEPGFGIEITPSGKKYKIKAFTLERGQVTAPGSEFDFSGNTDLSGGTFSADKITFSGSEGAAFIPGADVYTYVIVEKSAGVEVILLEQLLVNHLKLIQGNLNAQGKNITANQDVDLSGGTLHNPGNLLLGGDQPSALKTGNNPLDNLVVDKETNVEVETLDPLTCNHLDIMGGIFQPGNNTTFNNSVNVTGGTLVLEGTPENRLQCSGNAGSGVEIVVDENGTIKAQCTDFNHLGESGIYVKPGATIDPVQPFYACSFKSTQSSGTLLTIDNDQELVIEDATLDCLTGYLLVNIKKNQDAGNVTVVNPAGNLSGPAFEVDPFGRVKWSGGTQTQKVDFPSGWSSLSSFLPPDNPELEVVFDPIQSELIIVRTMTGTYCPATNTNTIGNWPDKAAFSIKTTAGCSFYLTGAPYTGKILTLTPGWNLLPVLSQDPVDVQIVFPPEKGTLLILKEVAGIGVYWPEKQINTIDVLIPGKAYYVKVSDNTTVEFPE